jgi:hypothetical protein
MKRLIYKDGSFIGDYPDKWEPPEESDIAQGLKDGSMLYQEGVSYFEYSQPITRVDAIIADPDELMKLKIALENAK